MVTRYSYCCILLGILALFAVSVVNSIDTTLLSRLGGALFKGAALFSLTTGFVLIWGVLLRQKISKEGLGHSVPWLTYILALLFAGLSGLPLLIRLFSSEITDGGAAIILSAITVLLFVLILPPMSIHVESEIGHWRAGRFRVHESVIGGVCIVMGILFLQSAQSGDHLGLLALTAGAFLFGRDHIDVLNHRFVERMRGNELKK
jgi:hypothetical protein